MKYLQKQPMIFGSEDNKNYEDTWERVFGRHKQPKRDAEGHVPQEEEGRDGGTGRVD